ncbi:MAG: hypothetical protein WDA02_03050 [Saccharofermentanales bacterium]|jgi:hypothetical protein
MDDFLNNIPMTLSIIDYIGKMENGVSLLLNLVYDNISYEIGYWFDKDGNIKIVPENKLLDNLGVSNIYEYDKINELIYFIHNNIPNKIEILNKFLN